MAAPLGSMVLGASILAAPPEPMPEWPTDLSGKSVEIQHANATEADFEETDSNASLQIIDEGFSVSTSEIEGVDLLTANGSESISALDEAPQSTNSTPTSPDSITAQRVEVLRSTGLIARQAAISESIIIMERQLRQAELIQQLMAIYGPSSSIEIAPGEFQSFGQTPAGRKIAADIEETETESRIRLLELQAAEAELSGRTPQETTDVSTMPLLEFAPDSIVESITEVWPRLSQIVGTDGVYQATFSTEEGAFTALEGEVLLDGMILKKLTKDTAWLQSGSEERELRLGR